LGSSKKLDLETEIEPESDTILDGMGDLDDVDDLDDLSLDEEFIWKPSTPIYFQTGKNDLFCYGKSKSN